MSKHTSLPWHVAKWHGTVHGVNKHSGEHFAVWADDNDTLICPTGIDYASYENAQLIVNSANCHDALLNSLESALRYIEVSLAYSGAMTPNDVEKRIKDVPVAVTEIAANSCTTLAMFDLENARQIIAKAKGETK